MATTSSAASSSAAPAKPGRPSGVHDLEAAVPRVVSGANQLSSEGSPTCPRSWPARASAFSRSARSARSGRSVPKPAFTAPKTWMMVFGVVLAVCAGVVDVVTSRGLKVFVSHVTGNIARVGMRIEGVTTGMNETWDAFHVVLLVASFITGSFLCGLVVPKNQVRFGEKSYYGIALLGNSGLLVAAAFVAPAEPVFGEEVTQVRAIFAGCLAAMACGLQNAMCTMHFGAIVRTTHVTGTATDIGSTAGRASMALLRGLRHGASERDRVGLHDEITKLCVLLPLFTGFLCGAILGAFLHSAVGINALFAPAAITGSTGFLYTFFHNCMARQLKKIGDRLIMEDLGEIEATLQRAQSRLSLARTGKSSRDREEDLESLEDFIDESLRVMRDFEETVAEFVQSSDDEGGVVEGTVDQPRRAKSSTDVVRV